MMNSSFFFFNDTATTEIYTLSLHDALPISAPPRAEAPCAVRSTAPITVIPSRPATSREALSSADARSEEHTSELQSLRHLVCRLLLEKKNSYIIMVFHAQQSFSQFIDMGFA